MAEEEDARPRLIIDTSRAHRLAVKLAAEGRNITGSKLLSDLIEREFPREFAIATQVVNGTLDEPKPKRK